MFIYYVFYIVKYFEVAFPSPDHAFDLSLIHPLNYLLIFPAFHFDFDFDFDFSFFPPAFPPAFEFDFDLSFDFSFDPSFDLSFFYPSFLLHLIPAFDNPSFLLPLNPAFNNPPCIRTCVLVSYK